MSAIPTDRPLRLAVTGTPGTGKTTATERLAERIDAITANAKATADANDGDGNGNRDGNGNGNGNRDGNGDGNGDVDGNVECDGERETAALEGDCVDVVHLNDVIQAEELYDEVDDDRDSVVADLDAVQAWVDDYVANTDALVVVLDSHLAHHLDVDRVVVLRCHPEEIARRLTDRGEPSAKARENAESEALDVVLGEAVESHGEDAVYEIETTDLSPAAVADEIAAVVADDRAPSAGTVDYIDYL